jgi:hypothetical protein
VVGSTDEDPVGHLVNENHLGSQPHGTPQHAMLGLLLPPTPL